MLKTLWLRRAIVARGVVVAAIIALLVSFHVSLFPPSLHSRQHHSWIASSQVLIDSPTSAVGDLGQGLDGVEARAGVYGDLASTSAVLDVIARDAGVPAREISVSVPAAVTGGTGTSTPVSAAGYKLTLTTEAGLPTLLVTAQGPTRQSAIRLANGVASGLSSYVGRIADQDDVIAKRRVVIQPMGAPMVAPHSSGITPVDGFAIFLVLVCAWCGALLLILRTRAAWRAIPDESVAPKPSERDGALAGAWSRRRAARQAAGRASQAARALRAHPERRDDRLRVD